MRSYSLIHLNIKKYAQVPVLRFLLRSPHKTVHNNSQDFKCLWIIAQEFQIMINNVSVILFEMLQHEDFNYPSVKHYTH